MTELSQDRKRELLGRLLRARAERQPKGIAEQSGRPQPNAPAEPALHPIARDGNLLLSFAQERVWFLEQLLPQARLFNVVERFRFSGRLDVEVLRQSIETVVGRHEVLRTTYPLVDDWPVQKRLEKVRWWNLRFIDLRSYPAGDRAREAHRLTVAEAKMPFVLAAGPPLRTTLFQLADNEYALALTAHHIAIDGWSLGLFMHELVASYGALVEGRMPILPQLQVQYADFAHWQRRWLTGDLLSSQRDYWLGQLGKEPPILDLPTDHVRPAVQTFAGDRYYSPSSQRSFSKSYANSAVKKE